MTEQEVTAYIRGRIKQEYGTINAFALASRVNGSHICNCLKRNKFPRWMLVQFGVVKQVTYNLLESEP